MNALVAADRAATNLFLRVSVEVLRSAVHETQPNSSLLSRSSLRRELDPSPRQTPVRAVQGNHRSGSFAISRTDGKPGHVRDASKVEVNSDAASRDLVGAIRLYESEFFKNLIC